MKSTVALNASAFMTLHAIVEQASSRRSYFSLLLLAAGDLGDRPERWRTLQARIASEQAQPSPVIDDDAFQRRWHGWDTTARGASLA